MLMLNFECLIVGREGQCNPDGGIYASLRQAGTHGRRRVDVGRQRTGKERPGEVEKGDLVIR